jgi:hypothetical protein
VANCFCENDSKQLERGWFTGQRFCYRLSAELTGASLKHDIFRFEFLQKKVRNFHFSVRNSRRHFVFPSGEGVEFFTFRREEAIDYFLDRRSRLISIFRKIFTFQRFLSSD